ncbi:GIY-YIG nuclease family protein [Chloroflexota bacterium]
MNSQNQLSVVIKRANSLKKSGLTGTDAYKQAWNEIKRHDDSNKQVNTEYSKAWEKGDKEATRFFVYILKLDGGEYYIGHTRDLRPRLVEHRNGTTVSTKGKTFRLQYFEILPDRTAARIREYELKKLEDSNPRTIIQMLIDFKDLINELKYD